MSLTSYRAAPPRVELGGRRTGEEYVMKGRTDFAPFPWSDILFVDLATTYSPAP
jgi:hypothetical protein